MKQSCLENIRVVFTNDKLYVHNTRSSSIIRMYTKLKFIIAGQLLQEGRFFIISSLNALNKPKKKTHFKKNFKQLLINGRYINDYFSQKCCWFYWCLNCQFLYFYFDLFMFVWCYGALFSILYLLFLCFNDIQSFQLMPRLFRVSLSP
jgi:hypothetical protein